MPGVLVLQLKDNAQHEQHHHDRKAEPAPELELEERLDRPVLCLHAKEAEKDRDRERRAEEQHPQHRLDGAALANAQMRGQKQQTQQKKRRKLRK